MDAEEVMEEKSQAPEVPERRVEPAPAETTKPIERMPGDTRGMPARPKNTNGDYVDCEPWRKRCP